MSTRPRIRDLTLAVCALALTTPASAAGPESDEQKLARAMGAAPLSICAEAKIVDLDGRVLRKGDSGWYCPATPTPAGPI